MKIFKEKYKKILVILMYLIISFIILLFHENWRDEAQAWLIARDCNLIELIRGNEV